MPPPPAVRPDDIPPDIDVPPDLPGMYDRLSFRVPAVIVSPYAKRNYVSHVTHDHTSVLKFIETKWNLGALTYRDANADNLLDSLNLHAPPGVPPAAGAAAAGARRRARHVHARRSGRPDPAAGRGRADRHQPLAHHPLVAPRPRRSRSAGSWP